MKNRKNMICLCPKCRQNFLATELYSLRRVCFPQENKDTCTYCQVRYGYDYYVIRRKVRRLNKEASYG